MFELSTYHNYLLKLIEQQSPITPKLITKGLQDIVHCGFSFPSNTTAAALALSMNNDWRQKIEN